MLTYRVLHPVFHMSLNPNPKDYLTDSKSQQVIREFMRCMGYEELPYIAFKHFDTTRVHYHVVGGRMKNDFKAVLKSFDYFKALDFSEQVCRKFGLISLKQHQVDNKILYSKKVDYQKGDLKSQISSVVRDLTRYYYFKDFPSYLCLLNQVNLTAISTNTDINTQLVYYPLDINKQIIGNGLSCKTIGKFSSIDNLQKQIQKSQEFLTQNLDWMWLEKLLTQQINTAHSLKQLQDNLSVLHIDVILKQKGFYVFDYHNRYIVGSEDLSKAIVKKVLLLEKQTSIDLPHEATPSLYYPKKELVEPMKVKRLEAIFSFLQKRHDYFHRNNSLFQNQMKKELLSYNLDNPREVVQKQNKLKIKL